MSWSNIGKCAKVHVYVGVKRRLALLNKTRLGPHVAKNKYEDESSQSDLYHFIPFVLQGIPFAR